MNSKMTILSLEHLCSEKIHYYVNIHKLNINEIATTLNRNSFDDLINYLIENNTLKADKLDIPNDNIKQLIPLINNGVLTDEKSLDEYVNFMYKTEHKSYFINDEYYLKIKFFHVDNWLMISICMDKLINGYDYSKLFYCLMNDASSRTNIYQQILDLHQKIKSSLIDYKEYFTTTDELIIKGNIINIFSNNYIITSNLADYLIYKIHLEDNGLKYEHIITYNILKLKSVGRRLARSIINTLITTPNPFYRYTFDMIFNCDFMSQFIVEDIDDVKFSQNPYGTYSLLYTTMRKYLIDMTSLTFKLLPNGTMDILSIYLNKNNECVITLYDNEYSLDSFNIKNLNIIKSIITKINMSSKKTAELAKIIDIEWKEYQLTYTDQYKSIHNIHIDKNINKSSEDSNRTRKKSCDSNTETPTDVLLPAFGPYIQYDNQYCKIIPADKFKDLIIRSLNLPSFDLFTLAYVINIISNINIIYYQHKPSILISNGKYLKLTENKYVIWYDHQSTNELDYLESIYDGLLYNILFGHKQIKEFDLIMTDIRNEKSPLNICLTVGIYIIDLQHQTISTIIKNDWYDVYNTKYGFSYLNSRILGRSYYFKFNLYQNVLNILFPNENNSYIINHQLFTSKINAFYTKCNT